MRDRSDELVLRLEKFDETVLGFDLLAYVNYTSNQVQWLLIVPLTKAVDTIPCAVEPSPRR